MVCFQGFPKSLDKGDWSQMIGFSLQKSAQICTKCKLPSSSQGLMIQPKLIFLNVSQVLPVHVAWWNRHLIWELTTWKVKGDTPAGKTKGHRPACEKVVGNRGPRWWLRAVVPNLFGTRDQFHRRQFFLGPEVADKGDGLGMIQVCYIYCAPYFYYYYIIIIYYCIVNNYVLYYITYSIIYYIIMYLAVLSLN